MAETRTPRFQQPQWSSGSDAPSRTDFNEGFGNTEKWAAYDNGQTTTGLPSTNLVAARYAMVDFGADGRSLYRYNGTTFDFVGGTVIPRFQRFKALEGQALTDSAIQVEHPSLPGKGVIVSYQGDVTAAGKLKLFGGDVSRGTLVVGWDGATTPAANGRAYIRTRADGEFGLVLHGHSAAAGQMLAVREPGGQDMFTVDAIGRMAQRTFAAFGGGVMPSTSMVTFAPTSDPNDAVVNGVLFYGQSAAPSKSILQVWRELADTVPIFHIVRDGISLGRLPWGAPDTDAGTMTFSANTTYFRASGNPDNGAWFLFRRTDPTSAATEADSTKDVSVISVGPDGIGIKSPMYVSQQNLPGRPTMTLYRHTDFAYSFLSLARVVPDGAGGETFQLASAWESDGRLKTGAWWKGTGTMRDARQSVRHLATKIWAAPGDSPTAGIAVPTNGSFTYEFPAMTVRSNTTADLNIGVVVELMLANNPDGSMDAQNYSIATDISFNGGAYGHIATQENAQTSTFSGRRQSGDLMSFTHRTAGIPAGATFRIRLRFTTGWANPTIYIRKFDINVDESLFELYPTA